MSEDRFKSIEKDIAELKTGLAVAQSTIKEMKAKLTNIDNNTTWTVRLVIGAILLSLLNVLLNGTAIG